MAKTSTNTAASWGLRLSAVAFTLLVVVAVFAVRFSRNGNEMQAVMSAALPVVGGLVAAFLFGLIGKFSASAYRWRIYLYALLAIALYLIVSAFL